MLLYKLQNPFKLISIASMSLRVLSLNEKSLKQSLLTSYDPASPIKHSPILNRMKQCIYNDVQTCERTIFLNGHVSPINQQKNIIKNTKYTLLSFVPLVVINQFRHFFNLFFLVNAVTQLCPLFRVGLLFTGIAPLLLVLFLTMGKEAYQNFKTYQRDKEANSKEYEILTVSGVRRVKSEDLKVGQIFRVLKGDRIPADMVILHSDAPQGEVFIKTDQLDGETDWKLRKAVKLTQAQLKTTEDILNTMTNYYFCKIEKPTGEIYNFKGVFNEQERLTLENTMWANTVLTSGTALGLVVYVGKETRISIGGQTPRPKFGILDDEINTLSKFLFLIMVILVGVFLFLQRTQLPYVPVQFMRMIVLLSSIIPISMRVNLDFAKFFYAVQVGRDELMRGAVVRNTNCPEELGRVKYVLSDKTGTITKNQMVFKEIRIDEELSFTNQELNKMKEGVQNCEGIVHAGTNIEFRLSNAILAIALCNNVTPIYNEDQIQHIQYQASSPDEVQLVKLAQKLGISISKRTQSSITLKMPNKTQTQLQIKYVFPFTSEAKRMGLILQNKNTEQIVFFSKGADMVMKKFLRKQEKILFVEQQSKKLSSTGLRTLVICGKVLSQSFYNDWSQRYEKTNNRLYPDEQIIKQLMNELQLGSQLLALTGIEDRLRDNITETIQSLKNAKIKIWMITGDKMETAQCISKSCGLQRHGQSSYKIQNITHKQSLQLFLNELQQKLQNVLIIDGNTLEFLLKDTQATTRFFRMALKINGLICYRCSPKQKRMITQGVKKFKNEKEAVLGIGDGGNDIGMIQSANIGVGIVGKQGMQAALAADVSLTDFSHLKNLLFWHGRLSYVRSSLLASFIIHRGFLIAAIQLIFSCIFYYISIPVFNSYLQFGYATIFTFWPVFALILSKDVNLQIALKHAQLYVKLQREEYLSLSNFLVWVWKAIFQAATIIIFTLIFFQQDSYLQFQTVSFTVLIITEYFMAAVQMKNLHIYLVYCIIGSFACYALCLFYLRSYVHMAALSLGDWWHIWIIFAMSWGPIFVWKTVKNRVLKKEVGEIRSNRQENGINDFSNNNLSNQQ